MNNGQHSQGSLKVPDGAISADMESLNSNITEQFYVDSQPNSQPRDHETIGNKIINFSKDVSESSEITTSNQGQFDNIESITLRNTDNQYDKGEAIEHSFNQSIVKTTGKGLDPAAIKEAERMEKKELGEKDDAASYVDIIRGENGMVSANMENSYGANSAWKKAA